MPETTASPLPGKVFVEALATGFLWGIAGAVTVACVVMAVVVFSGPSGAAASTHEVLLMFGLWTSGFALALVVFPIGPVAALLGWTLFLRDVSAPRAYAAAGAIAAFAAPVLILIVLEARMPTIDWTTFQIVGIDWMAVIVLGFFPMIGAFAGYMAGRHIKRASLRS